MSELFLFVRPPRPLWPFNGPGSAFWPPLAFASLAAALRSSLTDLRVGILDAPALQLGWNGLAREIGRLRPAYVGIGEEAVSCVEGLRLAGLARRAGSRVVAGGCFFGHVAPELLDTGLVDVVVHGEGEETIVELLRAFRGGGVLRDVAGISFLDEGEPVYTGPRRLIEDLDRLPFPAYDLLPVERYGRTSRNHRALAAIELGRGCSHACRFCVLWRQMASFRGNRPTPRLRTKSPERLLEEIRLLSERFGRRYLGWVDPCFNADADRPRQLAELLLRDGLRLGQSAWVRADGIVRDASSGALQTCVDAGLNEVYIGIERTDDKTLRELRKGNSDGEVEEALRILCERFPEVLRVGSFIYGLSGDTPRSIRSLFRRANALPLDINFFIPLTPLPGTPYWRSDLWDPTGARFRGFSFLPQLNGDPVAARLTRTLFWCFALSWPPGRARTMFRALGSRDARRRSVARRHLLRAMRFTARRLGHAVRGRGDDGGLLFPRWYET